MRLLNLQKYMSYAVIQTGGKQYKVRSGEILKIETVNAFFLFRIVWLMRECLNNIFDSSQANPEGM